MQHKPQIAKESEDSATRHEDDRAPCGISLWILALRGYVEAQLTGLAWRSRLHSIQLSKECPMRALMHQQKSSGVKHCRGKTLLQRAKSKDSASCLTMNTFGMPLGPFGQHRCRISGLKEFVRNKQGTDTRTTLVEIYFTLFFFCYNPLYSNLGSVGGSVMSEILYIQLHINMRNK